MRRLLLAAPLALAACGSADNDPGPGNVSVGEARALDEAAEMIEGQQLPSEAVPKLQPASDASPATEKKPAG